MKGSVYAALAALLILASPQEILYAGEQAPDAEQVVVVLDAGHGGKDGGASRRWKGKTYLEKDLNLSIAKACKKELESYAGVKVYMTRSTDKYVTLEGRVNYAKKKNADLFVALHNNASLFSSVNGTCVYYPNKNYRASIGEQGKKAAKAIHKELVALGLKDNGVQIRNTALGTRYPDKSRADYYQVIKRSKYAGFPGLIVEHAFVTNYKDCTKYLGGSEQLKKLGAADADGIAAYFQLMPEGAPVIRQYTVGESDEVTLSWKKLKDADAYRVYRKEADEDTYECISDNVKGTKYVDEDTEQGTLYDYAVCGCSLGGPQDTYTELSEAVEVEVPQETEPEVPTETEQEGTEDAGTDTVQEETPANE